MQVTLKNYLKGIVTFIPGFYKLYCSGTGGTISARYCYAVWMRHLVFLTSNGLPLSKINKIAELGPGDSLGIGICALLSGINEYYALDIKAHSNTVRNLAMLSELIKLFNDREPIPNDNEFPSLWPRLADYSFPISVLSDEILSSSLSCTRLENIRLALRIQGDDNPIQITYIAPWQDLGRLSYKFIGFDHIFSQAVMEHVDEINITYLTLFKWLKIGGTMSHSIDYSSHGYTRDWNGHWLINPLNWKILKGKRIYFINRLCHSQQILAIRNSNFTILKELKKYSYSSLNRNELPIHFQSLSDDDLRISSAFVFAQKLTKGY